EARLAVGGGRRARLEGVQVDARTPFPNWPGLREAKLEELLCRIRSRPEYRAASPSATGSSPASPPPSKSPGSSSGDRRERLRKRLADGWDSSEDGPAAGDSPSGDP